MITKYIPYIIDYEYQEPTFILKDGKYVTSLSLRMIEIHGFDKINDVLEYHKKLSEIDETFGVKKFTIEESVYFKKG